MNPFMTSWRPAQVRLAPRVGQQASYPPPAPVSPRPSFIDSPLMAAAMDALVVVGSVTIALGYRKKTAKDAAEKKKYKNLSYAFFGLSGLSAIKFFLDGARIA